MIREMKMKCILYPIYILYAILSCVPVELNAQIKILKELVLEVEKALDDKNNEDVKFIYDPNMDLWQNIKYNILKSDDVIKFIFSSNRFDKKNNYYYKILRDNEILIGKNKFTDDKKQKFIKNLDDLKNRYSETVEIETLEDFIYCITKLPCSTGCPQIREFKLALLTEVETKKIDYYYCYFSPQAVILNMILQPNFKVDEKLPQNIKDFIGKTIKKSTSTINKSRSYRVRAASMAKSAGFSVKSFFAKLPHVEYRETVMLDESTNVLNLMSMFKEHQNKEEIDRRKAIINKDANDKDAKDSDIDNVMKKNDYYTNGYYLTKNFDKYNDIMFTGIAFFQWIDDYLYSFFSDKSNNTTKYFENNQYYHLKDKMYEEEYLSKKSKEATKDSIVKRYTKYLYKSSDQSETLTEIRTFFKYLSDDYYLDNGVLNKMIKQYKEDERITKLAEKIREILKQKEYEAVYVDREERTERTKRTSDSLNVSASLF